MAMKFINTLGELVKAKDGDKIKITFCEYCKYASLSGLYLVSVKDDVYKYINCQTQYKIEYEDLAFMIYHNLATVELKNHTYANVLSSTVKSKVHDMLESEFENTNFNDEDITAMVDIILSSEFIADTVNELVYEGAYEYAEAIASEQRFFKIYK